MSSETAIWTATQHAQRSMAIYQNEGHRLKGMVSVAQTINNAGKAVFYLDGKVKAREFKRGDAVPLDNGSRQKFERELKTFVVDQECQDFDLDRITVDEKEVLYRTGANALKRETDIQLYKEMNATAGAVDGSLNFSAGKFQLGQAMKLIEACVATKAPRDGKWFVGLPRRAYSQLTAIKEVASRDYTDEALPFSKDTDMVKWNGMVWFLNEEEDPLDFFPVPSANTAKAFAWHQSAIGWSNHTEMRVEKYRSRKYRRDEIGMDMKGVAVALQNGKGIVPFTVSTNTEIV